MNGLFLERSTDAHVQLRKAMLCGDAIHPGPATVLLPGVHSANQLTHADCALWDRLHECGLLVLQLDGPLSDEEFIEFGSRLGFPLPETDPTVKPHVSAEVLLNLVSVHAHTTTVALQPFATNFLSLHTEGSGRPIGQQPRYLVLMCLEPGLETAAQTVLVPTETVETRLSPDAIATLSLTRYNNTGGSPSIVRDCDGRRIFSFRDFLSQPLEWLHCGPDVHSKAINDTICELLAAMYSAEDVQGIHWRRGLLVILDNTFYFHGRTAATSNPGSESRRHLKRLRILK